MYVIEQGKKIEQNEEVMKEKQKVLKNLSAKKRERENIERLIEEDKKERKEKYENSNKRKIKK